jgi:hypothetical protein
MQLKKALQTSVYTSLFMQLVTGILAVYAYFLPVAGELAIIKKLLELEIFVQVVEGAFYIWFASTFSYINNVTPNRYYDWAITTPTMLFTFCLYLAYLGERDNPNQEPLLPSTIPENQYEPMEKSVNNTTLIDYLTENIWVFIPIFILNWLMLFFGYLGEIGKLGTRTSVGLGFIPFILYFFIIYNKFAKYSSFYGKLLYWVFFTVWSLYGVAALFSYYWKNIFYNILDLFAKNFFGLLLVYTTYRNAI